MIIKEYGAEFEYNGTTYVIGEPIIGTAESEYEGLFGTITEIRDGSDKTRRMKLLTCIVSLRLPYCHVI